MSHVLQTSPAQILKRLRKLATDGAALYERALREPVGPRELAQAQELGQQYVEILEEMETMEFNLYETVML